MTSKITVPDGTPSDQSVDSRLQKLDRWVRQVLGEPNLAIAPASADASFRRYFRATARSPEFVRTWIVMDAPPEKEDTGPYIRVAEMLRRARVNAPQILAANPEEGFLLLSDFGSRSYLDDLSAERHVDRLYRDALTALVRMQAQCTDMDALPPYDAALLRREMQLFPEWFVGKHLAVSLDAAALEVLDNAFACLVENALAQPRVFVHRDYHSRNLMVIERAHADSDLDALNPGVLDFQDAVQGPLTYDLVSLLRDCYVAWPLQRVRGWLHEYADLARSGGMADVPDERQLTKWFDLMGVQRHLKAIGIFARLWHRDGKSGYLKDIPRTLAYIRTVAPKYAELGDLAELIERQIAPALESQTERR